LERYPVVLGLTGEHLSVGLPALPPFHSLERVWAQRVEPKAPRPHPRRRGCDPVRAARSRRGCRPKPLRDQSFQPQHCGCSLTLIPDEPPRLPVAALSRPITIDPITLSEVKETRSTALRRFSAIVICTLMSIAIGAYVGQHFDTSTGLLVAMFPLVTIAAIALFGDVSGEYSKRLVVREARFDPVSQEIQLLEDGKTVERFLLGDQRVFMRYTRSGATLCVGNHIMPISLMGADGEPVVERLKQLGVRCVGSRSRT
jgi:hypothetical protein